MWRSTGTRNIDHKKSTLKEETFVSWNKCEIPGIYFREWHLWLYFARLNFCEQSLILYFARSIFRKWDKLKKRFCSKLKRKLLFHLSELVIERKFRIFFKKQSFVGINFREWIKIMHFAEISFREWTPSAFFAGSYFRDFAKKSQTCKIFFRKTFFL